MIDIIHHTYPSGFEPGKHWAMDQAWIGLDLIKPGLIPDDLRAFLAGYFSAALVKAAKEGVPKDGKAWPPQSIIIER